MAEEKIYLLDKNRKLKISIKGWGLDVNKLYFLNCWVYPLQNTEHPEISQKLIGWLLGVSYTEY